jgi:arylsulfatase A-like enzyme
MLAIAGLAAGCRAPTGDPAPVPANVVLVVIDTLRADHLGLYGYPRATSPFLDEWAREAVVFDHAVAAAPRTFPSVNVLLSGHRPEVFYRHVRDLAFPDSVTTLAEHFAGAGFRTAAVSSSPIVRRSPNAYTSASFERGFATFDDRCHDRDDSRVLAHTSACVTRRALALLGARERDRPLFLYVHYLDPHGPYAPPAAHDLFTDKRHRPGPLVRDHSPRAASEALARASDPDSVLPAADLRWLVDLYDGEIHAVDAELRRLVDGARRMGLGDDTLWVVTADHGESFLEHPGILKHGNSLFEAEIHVPLLFHWKERWSEGARIAPVACGMDMTPTLLALSGLAVPAALEGRPLFDAEARAAAGPDHSCVAQRRNDWNEVVADSLALRRGARKAVVDVSDERLLFDLASDPAERRSIEPGRAEDARLLEEAAEHLRRANARHTAEAPSSLSPDVQRALQALGYLAPSDAD